MGQFISNEGYLLQIKTIVYAIAESFENKWIATFADHMQIHGSCMMNIQMKCEDFATCYMHVYLLLFHYNAKQYKYTVVQHYKVPTAQYVRTVA